MNINNKKKTFLLIGILVLTMLLVSGGTFAYFRWISSEDQQTNLAIQIEENISMHIENPLLTKAGMYPTNTCTNEAATMSGVSIIALENQTGVIARPKFKLRVKITDKDGNVITNNSAGSANSDNPYRYFINYAVAEENGTCTEPLYSGNFDQNEPTYQGQTQWYDSEWITLMNESTGFPLISNGQGSGVSFNGTPYQTTYHNYKVWVWIDESYTSVNTGDVVSDKLQDAKIELSWSENSTVQQIKAQAYAVFSSSAEGGDDSLRFYQSDEPITEDSTYAGRPVTNVYTGFETAEYTFLSVPWNDIIYSIKSVIVEDTISPISTAYWFSEFDIVNYIDVTNLDTSNVTNMNNMFGAVTTAISSTVHKLTIEGLENWDTSKVTDMSYMFYYLASGSDLGAIIDDISGWNVSNVKNMECMFEEAGVLATENGTFDLSSWNVYKVVNYNNFHTNSATVITPPNWYTSYAVYSSSEDGGDDSFRIYRTTTDLNDETIWNDLPITTVYNFSNYENVHRLDPTSLTWYTDGTATKVKRVYVENEIYPTNTSYLLSMFDYCEYMDVSKIDMSNVLVSRGMFAVTGANLSANSITLAGLENWDVSNITDISAMFANVGYSTTSTVNIGNLSKWNTSSVADMHQMFDHTGYNAATIDLTGLERWNTSNVTNMTDMFNSAGYNADNFKLDLSNWDVSKVFQMPNAQNFNKDVENKVIAPNWIN